MDERLDFLLVFVGTWSDVLVRQLNICMESKSYVSFSGGYFFFLVTAGLDFRHQFM